MADAKDHSETNRLVRSAAHSWSDDASASDTFVKNNKRSEPPLESQLFLAKESNSRPKGERKIFRRGEARYRAKVKILFHKNLNLFRRSDKRQHLLARYRIGLRRLEAEFRQGRPKWNLSRDWRKESTSQEGERSKFPWRSWHAPKRGKPSHHPELTGDWLHDKSIEYYFKVLIHIRITYFILVSYLGITVSIISLLICSRNRKGQAWSGGD